MKIQGRKCTLTVLKDNEFIPLPYSEETVRQASKGYALPGVIGIRNREKRVITGRTIQGCVVTRLEENNVLALFLLLFYREEKFDLLADWNAYKIKVGKGKNFQFWRHFKNIQSQLDRIAEDFLIKSYREQVRKKEY